MSTDHPTHAGTPRTRVCLVTCCLLAALLLPSLAGVGRLRASGNALAAAPAPVAYGAYVSGAPWNPAKLDEYTALVGQAPAVVMWYQDWVHTGVREFNHGMMNAVAARGATPMVTWEPRDYEYGADQQAFALSTILAGNHDEYIRKWARDAAAWQQPFYLRFAHEMNGKWHPWSPGANGNTSAEYVAAWRHVVTLFRQEGATNVRWVWSPNIIVGDGTPYAELYPGDEWVDWVGVDGYNFGPTREWHTWTTFYDVFAASYDALAALTTKPLMIAETASTEIGGDKAAWIRRGLLTDLPTRFPRFQLVIWFHEDKETDWRVNSSPATLATFREVLAASTATPSPTPTPAPSASPTPAPSAPGDGYTVRYSLPPCPSGKWTVSLDTGASEVAVTCQP